MDTSDPNIYATQSQTVSGVDESQPPPFDPTASDPMVVMPSTEGHTNPLFYVIFAVTVIAFLGISYLLFQSFMAKKDTVSTGIVPSVRPSATPIAVTASATPVPIDNAVLKLRTIKDSDTALDIEANLINTDYTPISESLLKLDQKFKISSK